MFLAVVEECPVPCQPIAEDMRARREEEKQRPGVIALSPINVEAENASESLGINVK